MKEPTWKQIVDLSEVIAKKLKEEGNPHQEIRITQSKVRLVADEKGQPLPTNVKKAR